MAPATTPEVAADAAPPTAAVAPATAPADPERTVMPAVPDAPEAARADAAPAPAAPPAPPAAAVPVAAAPPAAGAPVAVAAPIQNVRTCNKDGGKERLASHGTSEGASVRDAGNADGGEYSCVRCGSSRESSGDCEDDFVSLCSRKRGRMSVPDDTAPPNDVNIGIRYSPIAAPSDAQTAWPMRTPFASSSVGKTDVSSTFSLSRSQPRTHQQCNGLPCS